MLFSERYGYKKIDEKLLIKDVPQEIRQRLWNVFETYIFMEIRPTFFGNSSVYQSTKGTYISNLWDKFFKKPLNNLFSSYGVDIINDMQKLFLEKLKWYEVYDFIDFFANEYPDEDEQNKETILDSINIVLKEEKVPYRIVNGAVRPLTSEEEIKEIEKALNISDKYAPIREHLSKALNLLSDRKEPDYANSIKESISSLESLVQITLGVKGTLADLLKGLNIHPALKQGFSNLYGWTSDDGGIRHGKTSETLEPKIEEARYMLITASAFINYVIAKEKDKK